MLREHYHTPYFWQKLRNKNLFFVFDFDGTLSPIVSDPASASMRAQTKKLLKLLCKTSMVGIISGRSLGDLVPRLNMKLDFVSGTHGLESPFSSPKEYSEYKIFFKGLQKTLKDIYPELTFENKAIGFSIHYRNINESTEIINEVLGILSTFPELKVIGGKKVLNILPNRPHDKGWVMRKLLEKYPKKYFFYVGDDTTDEDVFQIKNDRLLSIRIEKSNATHAPLFLNNQREIDPFLWSILSFKGITPDYE